MINEADMKPYVFNRYIGKEVIVEVEGKEQRRGVLEKIEKAGLVYLRARDGNLLIGNIADAKLILKHTDEVNLDEVTEVCYAYFCLLYLFAFEKKEIVISGKENTSTGVMHYITKCMGRTIVIDLQSISLPSYIFDAFILMGYAMPIMGIDLFKVGWATG